MKSSRQTRVIVLLLVVAGTYIELSYGLLLPRCSASEPIVVTPHPQAGESRSLHDADRPILAAYGGIGLRQRTTGEWDGYGKLDKKDVDYLLRRCQENGLRRLHPPMTEAFSPSIDDPAQSESVSELVEYFFTEARARGLEVFADLPVFAYAESADQEFVKRHPTMFTRSDSGKLDSHMLSAAYPEVRHHKRSMLMSYVRDYPVDGLQLDFIRFPYYTMDLREGFGRHGYDDPALVAFRSEYDLADDFMPSSDDSRWIQFKANIVSQFIRELRADLAASGISLPIGVYNSGTYGRADSLRTVHQDWQAWEGDSLVNEHHPMILMSAGMTTLTKAMQTLIDVKNEQSLVFGPIFLAEGFGYGEGDVPTPELVREAARRLIKLGCDGLWFCRPTEIEKYGLWPVVYEISQWSLEEIRNEDFDPFEENLLVNGEFQSELDAWEVAYSAEKNQSVLCLNEGGGLSVDLHDNCETMLSQTVSFRPIRHLPVDSLLLKYDLSQGPGAILDCDISVQAQLRYANGEEEQMTLPLALVPDHSEDSIVIKARTNYNDLVLKEITLNVRFPTGKGTVLVKKLELLRDPLLWNVRNDQ